MWLAIIGSTVIAAALLSAAVTMRRHRQHTSEVDETLDVAIVMGPPRCILCRAPLQTRPPSSAAAVTELERRIRAESEAVHRLIDHLTAETLVDLYIPPASR